MKKRLFILCLVLATLLAFSAPAAAEDWEGYTKITDAAGLRAIADAPAGNFYLDKDINLSAINDWVPIANFSGVLDGNHHKITGLTLSVSANTDASAGLFVNISGATVRNLELDGFAVLADSETQTAKAGCLAANITNSTIISCSCSGSVSARGAKAFAGGFCTNMTGCNAAGLTNTATVSAVGIETAEAGGIGSAENSALGKGQNSANVTAAAPQALAGGIFAKATAVSVKDAYNRGEITGAGNDYSRAGGICGIMKEKSVLQNTYNAGKIKLSQSNEPSGTVEAFGVTEGLNGTPAEEAAAAEPSGTVTPSAADEAAGAVAGESINSTGTNNYYLKDTAAKGTGLGTETAKVLNETEMGNKTSFTGFDFTNVWTVNPAAEYKYPTLAEDGGIYLSESEITIKVGDTHDLTMIPADSGILPGDVEWKSADGSIAAVDNTGRVKGIKEGKTDVTVTVKGTSDSAVCHVTVIQDTPAAKPSIKLSEDEITVIVDGNSKKLEVTATPKDTDLSNLVWSVKDKNVAEVDSEGNVTGLKKGQTIVTADLGDGITAECIVNVVDYFTVTYHANTAPFNSGKDVDSSVKGIPTDKTEYNDSDNNEAVIMGSGKLSSSAKNYKTMTDGVPTWNGYTFLGWATTSDAKAAEYKAGNVKKLDGDLDLYAVWKVDTTGNNSSKTNNNSKSTSKSPQTGDDNNLAFYIVLAAVSGLGVVYCIYRRKKSAE